MERIEEWGTPLFIVDLPTITRRFEKFKEAFPRVKPYYALKSLLDERVVETLAKAGAAFDCASQREIEMVRTHAGESAEFYYTHPHKRYQELAFCVENGVHTFTFDNEVELQKIAKYKEDAELFLRFSIPNNDSVVQLHRKFGASTKDCEKLLYLAREKGMRVKGLSFHMGSQSHTTHTFQAALHFAQHFIATMNARGFSIEILNIGGGIPVDYVSGDEAMFDGHLLEMNRLLTPIFDLGIAVIAEPGRFISAPAGFGLCSVIGHTYREGVRSYYIDDGVYGLYSGMLYDHASYPLTALRKEGGSLRLLGSEIPAPLHAHTQIFGTTCDSVDTFQITQYPLPDMQEGDYVLGAFMGAYTLASASHFNGLAPPPTLYHTQNGLG